MNAKNEEAPKRMPTHVHLFSRLSTLVLRIGVSFFQRTEADTAPIANPTKAFQMPDCCETMWKVATEKP